MPSPLKVTSFNVRATLAQSLRWKRAAEGEGFASVGSWAAPALDAYMEHRTRAGKPIALAWHHGTVRVTLDGSAIVLPGLISPPFGIFRGTFRGPGVRGCDRFTLVHLPAGRLIATLYSRRQAQALACELAPLLIRDEQAGAAVVERHVREAS